MKSNEQPNKRLLAKRLAKIARAKQDKWNEDNFLRIGGLKNIAYAAINGRRLTQAHVDAAEKGDFCEQ